MASTQLGPIGRQEITTLRKSPGSYLMLASTDVALWPSLLVACPAFFVTSSVALRHQSSKGFKRALVAVVDLLRKNPYFHNKYFILPVLLRVGANLRARDSAPLQAAPRLPPAVLVSCAGPLALLSS